MSGDTCASNEFDTKKFVEEVLFAHNDRRSKHESPPLRLDDSLMEQSQQCAEILLASKYVKCSMFPTIGENVCIIGTDDSDYTVKGEHPVHFWYQQKDIMIFGYEPFNHHTYNFSQIIWKTTELLGVGIAYTKNKIVIVCHYFPPGNILGEYVENVLPDEETKRRKKEIEARAVNRKTCAVAVDNS